MRLADYLHVLTATLWVGALWVVGLVAAPVLFKYSGNVMLAGELAGHMFAVVDWLGVVCGGYLLLFLWFGVRRMPGRLSLWLVAIMLVLTLVGHFGVTPIVVALRTEFSAELAKGVVNRSFATWHGIAWILWMCQSILGLVLLVRFTRRVPDCH